MPVSGVDLRWCPSTSQTCNGFPHALIRLSGLARRLKRKADSQASETSADGRAMDQCNAILPCGGQCHTRNRAAISSAWPVSERVRVNALCGRSVSGGGGQPERGSLSEACHYAPSDDRHETPRTAICGECRRGVTKKIAERVSHQSAKRVGDDGGEGAQAGSGRCRWTMVARRGQAGQAGQAGHT